MLLDKNCEELLNCSTPRSTSSGVCAPKKLLNFGRKCDVQHCCPAGQHSPVVWMW